MVGNRRNSNRNLASGSRLRRRPRLIAGHPWRQLFRMAFVLLAVAGCIGLACWAAPVCWAQPPTTPGVHAPGPMQTAPSQSGELQQAGIPPTAAPGSPQQQPPLDLGPQLPSENQTAVPQSFLEILKASGLIGALILLLSVAAVALVIEHAMTIRAAVLMPPGLGEQVRHLVAGGNLAAADQQCRSRPSLLAYVLSAGLAEADTDWPAVENAMEDAAAEQSARLLRKIEYLSVISNIAPMLGLLGTVVGMIFAFRRVAETQGAARAADLAEGIYLALVTTVEGLTVAIPSLAAFAFFRNRVDQLVAEAAHVAQHALVPLKRRPARGSRPGAAQPPVSAAPKPPPAAAT